MSIVEYKDEFKVIRRCDTGMLTYLNIHTTKSYFWAVSPVAVTRNIGLGKPMRWCARTQIVAVN